MPDRDQEEQDIRIDQMTINIEKMRFDMDQDSRRYAREAKMENRRFFVSVFAALGTGLAGGAAITGLILHALGKL